MPTLLTYRRTAAAVLAASLAASACAGPKSRVASPAGDQSSTSSTLPALPSPEPWKPSPSEPHAALKLVATSMVQTLATYPVGDGTLTATRQRLVDAGLAPSLADEASSLLSTDVASSATVRYPQLGGLTATAASVMVVTEVRTKDLAGARRTSTRVLDVRLELRDGAWRAASVASDGTGPPPAPEPAPGVVALLDNANVDLPDSAVADLLGGRTDPRVVQLLTTLAADWTMNVAVLATGHPPNVFGTDRQSNHTAGRGVDIWAVDGVAVIDQQDSPTLRALVAAALQAGATEIGAPFDTDGPGGNVFTNAVHLDHLHLAFRGS